MGRFILVATDQLLGIRLAKREIQDVNAFFTPRDRGVPRKVAVLFSQTNERHAFVNGGGDHRLFDALVQALDYAHLPIDVIFEQLKLNGRDANGKLVFGDWRVPSYKRGGWAYRADNDPETWETVWIAIDRKAVPPEMHKIISVALQFQMMPAEHSGLAFRNFRLEESE